MLLWCAFTIQNRNVVWDCFRIVRHFHIISFTSPLYVASNLTSIRCDIEPLDLDCIGKQSKNIWIVINRLLCCFVDVRLSTRIVRYKFGFLLSYFVTNGAFSFPQQYQLFVYLFIFHFKYILEIFQQIWLKRFWRIERKYENFLYIKIHSKIKLLKW